MYLKNQKNTESYAYKIFNIKTNQTSNNGYIYYKLFY